MYSLKALLFLLSVGYLQAQDANCDFSQSMQVGQTYYIYSPSYPSNYTPGVTCRWVLVAPAGYVCRAELNEIWLPSSPSCSSDRLLISRTGDLQLTSAEYYCGRGSLSAVSTGQRMSFGLVTYSSNRLGGRFMGTLTAQPATTTTQCSCGYRNSNRIVGGQQTKVNEFVMMAALYDVDQGIIKCGGTIIATTYVITAAHCIIGANISRLAVVVGEYDTTTGSDTNETRVYRISSAIIHPQYNSNNYDYDCAILTLAANIVFNAKVGPACLPFKYVNYDFSGSTVTLLGWGTTFFGGPTSNVLMKVNVTVVSQASCKQKVSALTAQQMCTYTPGKDACQYDSGGPVLYTDTWQYLTGIISNGQSCASSTPAVQTRITSLLNWIVANAPYDYCRK